MSIETVGRVVVGVDGSAAAMAAADLAAGQVERAEEAGPAGLGRAELVVVHACAGSGGAARSVMRTAVNLIHTRHPGVAVRSEIVVGDPVQVLLRRTAETDLMVLGGPRRRRGRNPAGTVVAGMLARASSPVMVQRGSGGRHAQVLVALDGGADGEPAIEFGLEEAARRHVPVLALGVGPATERDEHELADMLERWSQKFPEVILIRRTRRLLDSAVTVTAASRSAGLVVVGAPVAADRPSGALARVLVSRAACPVVAMPLGEPPWRR